jgi:hypothetical protein
MKIFARKQEEIGADYSYQYHGNDITAAIKLYGIVMLLEGRIYYTIT